ncbi:MAG TPA: L,D-transpeptidase [Acidimicrobiales bacterium]|nr:L,D-transpeptidase [Acidimicrobiales bacterium]
MRRLELSPRWRPLPGVLALAAVLLALASLAALVALAPRDERSTPRPRVEAAPQTTAATAAMSTVARSNIPSIPVFDSPAASAPRMALSSPNEDGAVRLFLVKEQRDGWLQVLLPVRPNGSKGWIRESDVTLSSHDYRVRVELGAHRITVWNGTEVVLEQPVGVGRANAPTPSGEYFITELLRPPDPTGAYGPYAFGLSGFSDVFQSFAGGPGTLGLHGTNDPAGLGTDVSSGCIRLSNESITKLAYELPLGAPVEVVA